VTEDALTPGTVTPIKAATATVVALNTEPADGESMPPQVAQVTAVAPQAVALPLATQTPAPGALMVRLQHLTTHTLPIAWYRIARVGPAGLVGAAATLAAILIATLALVAGRGGIEALTAQIAHVQAHPNVAAVSDAGVSKVVSALPGREDIPAVVGLVLDQARAANVTLDNGHYNYSAPKGGSAVGRYELEFPVKATYPNVRDFINRTLSAVPAAGLDKLRIERKAVGDPVVSADIRFVVFVRAEP
jgi:hypothetical protein